MRLIVVSSPWVTALSRHANHGMAGHRGNARSVGGAGPFVGVLVGVVELQDSSVLEKGVVRYSRQPTRSGWMIPSQTLAGFACSQGTEEVSDALKMIRLRRPAVWTLLL